MLSMTRVAGVTLILFSACASASGQEKQDAWADFRFLIGSWVSAGKAEEGSFTLEPDLQGQILLRRNVANLPAAKGRPAGRHEDLMIIYRVGGKQIKASYYDSEGHVIQYSVAPLAEKKGLVFVSDLESSGPHFRLTYTKGEGDTVAVKFEIAPPGKPPEFKTYLEGTVRRKNTAK
jgi:hypothetical protein